MNVNNSCPVVASAMASMSGNGNKSFGQALFKLVKSMQSLHLSFYLLMMVTLASQSRYLTSLILHVANNLLTLSFVIWFLSSTNFLCFCLTGL